MKQIMQLLLRVNWVKQILTVPYKYSWFIIPLKFCFKWQRGYITLILSLKFLFTVCIQKKHKHRILDSDLFPCYENDFFFYPLYDFDVLVENGTKETGYAVTNSKIDARKMVLEYFFLITPVTLHTKHLKAVFFFAVFFFIE